MPLLFFCTFLSFYNSLIIILERWFGKDWREVYLVLHEDSALMWYNERDDGSPQGGILLKDAPEMIAVGQVSLVEFSPCFLKRGFSDTYLQVLVQSILLGTTTYIRPRFSMFPEFFVYGLWSGAFNQQILVKTN